jgi:hypothetical protein
MLNFREHKDLIDYEATDVSPLDEASVEQSLVEARRNLETAAASVIYIQSTKIKSATFKIKAADTVEQKLDTVADTLDRMNTRSNALAAMTYFLTRK